MSSRHMKTHTKPYVCKHCSRGFSLNQDLVRHSTQHRNFTVLFHCLVPGCRSKGFLQKDNLRKHMGHHHKSICQRDDPLMKNLKRLCDKAILGHEEELAASTLHLAVDTNNEILLRSLVKWGNNPEKKDVDGKTALHVAVEKGNLQCACILLDAGADIDAADYRAFTPLQYAILADRLNILELLLARGTNHTKKSMLGSALRICMDRDNIPAAELLLRLGAEVESGGTAGWSSLHGAVLSHDLVMAALLLNHGANIDATTRYDQTPLFLAITARHGEMAQFLLQRGANANITSRFMYPLRKAVLNADYSIMELLFQHGSHVAEADGNDDLGRWSYAIQQALSHRDDSILHLLLSKGADPNVAWVQTNGKTALSQAISDGRETSLKLLLEHGASISAVDKFGRTPLEQVVHQVHKDAVPKELRQSALAIVKLLLDHGAEAKSLSKDALEFVIGRLYPGFEHIAIDRSLCVGIDV